MKQIKRIIFDLDGTLWQTRSSYVYAYQKLCEQYNIKLSSYDEVLKYMGVKVDILLKELFHLYYCQLHFFQLLVSKASAVVITNFGCKHDIRVHPRTANNRF